jgi:hypothetical protein
MKKLCLILFAAITSISSFAQTTPWSTTPTTTQTRKFNGANQLRWIWGSSNIYSLDDTLTTKYVTFPYFNNIIGTATQTALNGKASIATVNGKADSVRLYGIVLPSKADTTGLVKLNTPAVDSTGRYNKLYFNPQTRSYRSLNNINRRNYINKLRNGTKLSIAVEGQSLDYGLNPTGALGPINGATSMRSAFNPVDRMDSVMAQAGTNIRTINRGIPSAEAYSGYMAWDTCAPVDAVLIDYGINEATGNRNVDTLKMGLMRAAIRRINQGSYVVFALPIFSKRTDYTNLIKLVRSVVRDVAQELNCPVIDDNEAIRRFAPNIHQANDNTHLQDSAYAAMGEARAAFFLNSGEYIISPNQKYYPETVLWRSGTIAAGAGESGTIIQLTAGSTNSIAVYVPQTVEVWSTTVRTSSTATYMRWQNNLTVTLDTIGPSGASKTKKIFTLTPGHHVITVRNTGTLAVRLDNIEFRTPKYTNTAAFANNRLIVSSLGNMTEAAAITASRALVSNTSGIPIASAVTSTELGYVSGVTSAIQPQLNGKATNPMTTQGDIIYGGTSGTPTRLAIGGANTVLHGGTIPSYSAIATNDIANGAVTTAKADTSGTGLATKAYVNNFLTRSQFYTGNNALTGRMSLSTNDAANNTLTLDNSAVNGVALRSNGQTILNGPATLNSGGLVNGQFTFSGSGDVILNQGKGWVFNSTGGVFGIKHTWANATAPRSVNWRDMGGDVAFLSDIPTPVAIVEVAGTSQQLAGNSTYIFHNTSTGITANLPTVNPSIGTLITILVDGTGRVKITQNASQFIASGATLSTTGTSGYIQTNADNASISLRYVATNKWMVSQSNTTPTIF